MAVGRSFRIIAEGAAFAETGLTGLNPVPLPDDSDEAVIAGWLGEQVPDAFCGLRQRCIMVTASRRSLPSQHGTRGSSNRLPNYRN